MARGDRPLGLIAVTREDPTPFPDRLVELLQTFADQAVIAIENARLFEAEQTRTKELTESLEYQTAISDVLATISRSPTDVQPVSRLSCAAPSACATRSTARPYGTTANSCISRPATTTRRRCARRSSEHCLDADRLLMSGRAILERSVVQVADVLADPDYSQQVATAGGFRSVLAVPLLREAVPSGSSSLDAQRRHASSRTPDRSRSRPSPTRPSSPSRTPASSRRSRRARRSWRRALGSLSDRDHATCSASSPARRRAAAGARLDRRDGAAALRRRYVDLPAERRRPLQLARHIPAISRCASNGRSTSAASSPGTSSTSAPRTSHGLADAGDEFTAGQEDARRLGHRTRSACRCSRRRAIGALILRRKEVRPFTDEADRPGRDLRRPGRHRHRERAPVRGRSRRGQKELSREPRIPDGNGRGAEGDHRARRSICSPCSTRSSRRRRGSVARDKRVHPPARWRQLRHWPQPSGLTPNGADRVCDRHRTRPGPDRVGRAFIAKRTVHVPDVLADPRIPQRGTSQLIGFRAVVGVPLLREGEAFGVMSLMRRKRMARSPTSEIALLETFADQAVIAIENARLFEAEQTRHEGADRESSNTRRRRRRCSPSSRARRTTCSRCSTRSSRRRSVSARRTAPHFMTERTADYHMPRQHLRCLDEYRRAVAAAPIASEPGSCAGRAMRRATSIHVPDVQADPEIRIGRSVSEVVGARSRRAAAARWRGRSASSRCPRGRPSPSRSARSISSTPSPTRP